MKKTSLKKRIACSVAAGIIILGAGGGIYQFVKATYFKTVDTYLAKDITAELGSTDNPFTVVEIVTDESMGTFGYYMPGYEPVSPKQAGYDYNAVGTSIYNKLVNGGVMKLGESTEYGIPTNSGTIMKLGYAYDVFEEAGGIIGIDQKWELTADTPAHQNMMTSGAPVYIEEGYYIKVDSGKGHYNLNTTTHQFERADDGFAYLYSQGVNNSVVNGSFAANKNAGYTGAAGGDYDWVKTGYYISTAKNNADYFNQYGNNIYNKQPFIMNGSNPLVDGARGSQNDYSGNTSGGGTDYRSMPGWNEAWMELINRIYTNTWEDYHEGDFALLAELDEFVKDNVHFDMGSISGYTIKSGIDPVDEPSYETTKSTEYNPEGYDGPITVGSDKKYNCKDEEFFKRYIYLYNNCVANSWERKTLDIDLGAFNGVYSTGYNYFSYSGSTTPYLDLDTYTVNADCTDSSPERFYTLRAEMGADSQPVVGTKFYYYENTNALIDRIFGEFDNPDDIEYQYILVTTAELRAADSSGNLAQKYKDLLDYADFIGLPGDYALQRKQDYVDKYYRFHPEKTQPSDAQLSMKTKTGGTSGYTYDNDIPASVAYEIFLRQAGALEIDGLRPAGIMIDNLNSTGSLDGSANGDWNYMKLFTLLMEYGPANLYVNHVEANHRIWVQGSKLMAKPLYGASANANTANWYKQMFEAYSAEVNDRAYAGAAIISGNVMTLDTGMDFANNFTKGSVMSGDNFRTADLINSTYIDDENKTGNNFTAVTVFEYLIGANDNYKNHISVLELQDDDGNFISGKKLSGATKVPYQEYNPIKDGYDTVQVTDRADRYYRGYPLTLEEEALYESYLLEILPWFTGTGIKYPAGATLEEKRHIRFEKNFTVKRMTVAEFNASTEDICGKYDLIIFGSGSGENTGADLTDKKYTEMLSFLKMGAVIFDSNHTKNMAVFNGKKYIKSLVDIANGQDSACTESNYKTVTPAFHYKKLMGGELKYAQLKALTNAVAQYKCQVIMNDFDMPDPYVSYVDSEGRFTGGQYSGNILTYSFKFKGMKNGKYRCQLFIDRDGVDANKVVHACDGVFDGTVKQNKALAAAFSDFDASKMGTEAIPVTITGSLSSDGYLVRNKSYTVTCNVEDYKLNGYLPWKLEIYNIDNDNIRTTVTGNTCVSNGTKSTIRVLQMCPTEDMHDVPASQMINMATTGLGTSHWGEHVDVGAGEKFRKYMDAVNNNGDCEISIRYKSNADWLKEFNNTDGDATAWIDELQNYDIVVLGFSQSLHKSGNAIFNEGINNFISSGRGIIYGNNYLNTASAEDRTRAALAGSQKAAGNKHRVLLTNETKISNYPYNLVDKSGPTYFSNLTAQCVNMQDYTLNLGAIRQGDAVVSYSFSDTNGVPNQENVPNGDARGLYYIYNSDNITFMGLGCNTQYGNNVQDDEVKLFINTLYGAYRKIPDTPYLVVTNEDFYPNNVKSALSTGYVELIGDTSGVDVEVGLKALYDLDEIDFQKWEVKFLDKGDSSSMSTFSTEKGCTSVADGGRTGTVVRSVPFSFTSSYDRAIQMKGNYYVRLTTTYNRKGYTVEVPYLQKIQILPMAMFDLY